MIQWFMVALLMPFVYPAIFFSSLHVLKASDELRYTVYLIWAQWLLKMSSTKVTILQKQLIPLENGYVFVAQQANKMDPLIVSAALPVQTYFMLDQKARVPFIHLWIKMIRTLMISSSKENFTQHETWLEQRLSQANLTLFLNNHLQENVHASFYEVAFKHHLTFVPLKIENNRSIFKKGAHHHVKVTVGIPLYHEEYALYDVNKLKDELFERIH